MLHELWDKNLCKCEINSRLPSANSRQKSDMIA